MIGPQHCGPCSLAYKDRKGNARGKKWKMADKTQTADYKVFWQSYETDKEDAFYRL